MQFRIGKMMLATLGLLGLVAAAPAAADDQIATAAPISAVSAVSAMTSDDSTANPASTVADARHAFLSALASDRTVTAWIPLQDVPMPMGPLGFYSGSQRVAAGRDLGISDASEADIPVRMAALGHPYVCTPFALGDVSFHLGWTFHRAEPNTSARPRSVMTVIYMAEDTRLLQSLTPVQENDRAQWCPGVAPGLSLIHI